jgi:DNA replication ATP-dependent helicase Dna2
MRKPLLTSLVRSTGDISPALVWGSMLHEVMQRCLLEEKWDEVWIDKCLHNAISGGLGELVKLGISEEVALMEMRERAKDFRIFAGRYLGDVPKVNCFLLLSNRY